MFGLSITERGHRILREYIRKGDVAVDCTAGHGLDTLFLAECVGEEGAVHAFEIQVKAINELKEKFRENPQVTIHGESYVNLSRYVSAAKVIMYNLGYLPGGDCDLTTKTEETLRSLEQACQLVLPKGVISVVAYPGHPEGAREAAAVEEYLKALPGSVFEVLTLRQTNRSAKTPVQHFVFRNR